MKHKYKIGVPLSLFAVFGFVAIVCAANHPAPDKAVIDDKSRPVKTLVVSEKMAGTERIYPGKVRASKRVNLSFEISGVLTSLPVREGVRVEKGDILARLDQRDYINSLNSAKALFTEADLNFKRSQKLLKEGIVAQSEFDKYKSSYDTALANYEISKKALEDTELRAPFAGIVSKRYVENHEHITAHSNIVGLRDVSNIEIVIQLPEDEMANIRDLMGSKMVVVYDAIAGRTFSAKVVEYSVEANAETQTYEVVLSMASPKDYNILPGMTAQVKWHHGSKNAPDRLILPATAFCGDSVTQKSFVYVVKKPEMVLGKIAVTVGSPTPEGIPVISGLAGNEEIVVAGCAYLKEGMPVRIMPKY